MTHWTHICMNCYVADPVDRDALGLVTTVDAAGRCERCGSEAVAPLAPAPAPPPTSPDPAEKDARIDALRNALAAYRAMHKGKRRCKACVQADELLGAADGMKP